MATGEQTDGPAADPLAGVRPEFVKLLHLYPGLELEPVRIDGEPALAGRWGELQLPITGADADERAGALLVAVVLSTRMEPELSADGGTATHRDDAGLEAYLRRVFLSDPPQLPPRAARSALTAVRSAGLRLHADQLKSRPGLAALFADAQGA